MHVCSCKHRFDTSNAHFATTMLFFSCNSKLWQRPPTVGVEIGSRWGPCEQPAYFHPFESVSSGDDLGGELGLICTDGDWNSLNTPFTVAGKSGVVFFFFFLFSSFFFSPQRQPRGRGKGVKSESKRRRVAGPVDSDLSIRGLIFINDKIARESRDSNAANADLCRPYTLHLFTRGPDESYRRRFWSLLLYSGDVFRFSVCCSLCLALCACDVINKVRMSVWYE